MLRPPSRRRRARPSVECASAESLERRTLLSLPPIGPQFRVDSGAAARPDQTTSQRAVASSASGDFVAVWETIPPTFGEGRSLYARRYNAAGAAQGGEILVAATQQQFPMWPSVSMDAAGNFVVAWEQYVGSDAFVYYRRYNSAGTPLVTVQQLSQVPSAHRASVAVDADGDFVIAWEQFWSNLFDFGWRIDAVRFDATGAVVSPEFVVPQHRGTAGSPQVATSPDGRFVVTWRENGAAAGDIDLYARVFSSSGAGVSGDVLVNTFQVFDHQHQRVAMDAAGNFVVTWGAQNEDGDSYGVYARRFNADGTPLFGEFRVNTNTAGSQASPSVAMDNAGRFVVSYLDGTNAVAREFDRIGSPVGPEFALPDPSQAVQAADVAMSSDGNMVAVWNSSDGTTETIQARLFGTPDLGRAGAYGTVFLDQNVNGTHDTAEGELAGWTVYHDLNNNGRLDTGTDSLQRSVGTPIPPGATRRYLGPAAGTAAGQVITDVNVTLNLQHPRDGDLSVFVISPGGTRVLLVGGAGGANFFGTTFDDSATASIAQGVAPFSSTFRPQQPLSAFNGEILSNRGYWMLEIQNAGSSTGIMIDWTVRVTHSESSDVTSGIGFYTLSLPVGTSTVRQVLQPGFVQTAPASDGYTDTLGGAGEFAVLHFGNAYAGFISGIVFHDLNADGVAQPGESYLSGWTVFADLNHNGALDPLEPRDVSTPAGYSLRGIPLNTPVTLGAIPPTTVGPPWQVSAAPGPVTLSDGQPTAIVSPFGAFHPGSISGTVFDDLDGNGVRGAGEPGLAGWRVYQDQNGNGLYDDGTPRTTDSADVPKSFTARGAARSGLTLSGVTGPITHLGLTLDLTVPVEGTVTARLYNRLGESATLFEGYSVANGDLHGITFDDEADVPFAGAQPPYSGRFLPAQPLIDLAHGDPNGVWTLEVTSDSPGRLDHGTINSWSLGVSTPPEPSALTGASGAYAFSGLRPGNYVIREQPQAGWTLLAPAGGVYNAAVFDGSDAGPFDFANRNPSALPRVTQVYVRGSAWAAPFLTYLQGQALGSSQYGFAVGGGTGELLDLPWTNVNQISIAFSADVQVDGSDLSVRGVNVAAYPGASFVYNAADRTATWTFAQSIAKDKVLLDLDGDAPNGVRAAAAPGAMLDGEWASGAAFPSGNGTAGGDFRFRLNLLGGDVNRSGTVLANDFSEVKARFFRSTTSPGSGATAYSVFHDVDASGTILANDFSAVKARFFNALPGPEPTSVLVGFAAFAPPRRAILDA